MDLMAPPWELLLMPDELGTASFLLLIATSFVASLITAALGLGGGMLLLAVMASLMPVTALIPVHGIVQVGSNAGRTWVMRDSILPPLVRWFVPGALIGIALASLLVVELQENVLTGILALYILYSAWGPPLPFIGSGRKTAFGIGLVSSLLTMFVGATGPFVATLFAKGSFSRAEIVATHAACMTQQHLLKILAFGLLGFSFSQWIPLIALMIGAGFLGTLVGRQLLMKIEDRHFKLAFKTILSLIAIKLLVASLSAGMTA